MPNQDTLKELTAAQVMVNGQASFASDGVGDAGITSADISRGFVKETLSEEGCVDADGTNRVGDPYSRPGFAGAPSKYKRL